MDSLAYVKSFAVVVHICRIWLADHCRFSLKVTSLHWMLIVLKVYLCLPFHCTSTLIIIPAHSCFSQIERRLTNLSLPYTWLINKLHNHCLQLMKKVMRMWTV